MANLIVDGFATYGNSNAPSTSIEQAMLAGAYAEIGPKVTTTLGGTCVVQKGLPWDTSDTSYWINAYNGGSSNTGLLMAARRVIAKGALAVALFSCRISLSQLPASANDAVIMDIRDASNNIMGTLSVDTTGVLVFQPHGAGGALRSTSAVIVAQKAHHIEAKFDMGTSAVTVKVDEVSVIAGTATYDNGANIAQFAICGSNEGGGLDHNWVHMTDLIVRDTTGSFNNDFVGDRRVATLYPDADDPTNDGWRAQPLKCFGAGVLNLTASNAGVRATAAAVGAIADADFTLEGKFRFQSLPTNSNKAVLFGQWSESSNERSYQLYLGGPTLDSGNLVFRTSTDGSSGTVVQKLVWPMAPDTEHWYLIAVNRVGGVLQLYIDGVQCGVDVADTDTYFASNSPPALGCQLDGSNSVVPSTSLVGWQDELRLTIGTARYTTNYTPQTDKFPRGSGGDSDWLDVAWLSGWDSAAVSDDGPNGVTLVPINATAITPDDGTAAYQTINKPTPSDDTFIEAALLPATGILTFTGGNALNTETVTVATKDGSTAAVYTFKTALASAFDVLIGATAADSTANLINAINKGPGEGTTYGTGTTANNDVQASLLPTTQMEVTALVPGSAGNSLASTETLTHGAWGGATLSGGQDIPSPSAFSFERLPPGATIVDSVTFVGRQFKTDGGLAKTKQTMLGVSGGTIAGTESTLGTAPNLVFDTFEEDPDSPGDPLTPTVVRTMRVLINRTA